MAFFLEDRACVVPTKALMLHVSLREFAHHAQGSGRHWVEWYDRTQLKPRSGGLHRSMVDITPPDFTS